MFIHRSTAPSIIAVVWGAVLLPDGTVLRGELWTHPHGVDARLMRNGREVTGIVHPDEDAALAYLDRHRRLLTGDLVFVKPNSRAQ